MEKALVKAAPIGRHDASYIALKLLKYLADDGARFERFLSLSGMSLGDVKEAAESEHFQAGVLDFALSDESLLLAFAANEGLQPQHIVQLRAHLPGFAQ